MFKNDDEYVHVPSCEVARRLSEEEEEEMQVIESLAVSALRAGVRQEKVRVALALFKHEFQDKTVEELMEVDPGVWFSKNAARINRS